MENTIKRQPARKVSIATIAKGKYIKQDGWEPNYIAIGTEKVSRVNILGVITGANQNGNYETLYIDDGTGGISIRNFDGANLFSKLQIGDIIMIIGRPREFSGQIYLIPEIARKIEDKKWIDYRLLELRRSPLEAVQKQEHPEQPPEEQPKPEDDTTQIYNLIKEIDRGHGADYETILEKKGKAAYLIIEKLLKEGEIFEIAPGKLKVL